MEGFDDAGVFYSDNFGEERPQQVNLQVIKKQYKEFLYKFHEDTFNFKYRLEILGNNLIINNYFNNLMGLFMNDKCIFSFEHL